jgi:hypothetical protein
VAASQASVAGEIRTTGWFDTHSRIRFYPLQPKPEEILIEDIAHALARLCRWGGHSDGFYSVAQHSCFVAQLLETHFFTPEVCFAGLMHDAAEAYFIDLPRPLKRQRGFVENYAIAEEALLEMICEKFGVIYPLPLNVKACDDDLLHYEACHLFNPPLTWARNVPLQLPIMLPWTPAEAEYAFLRRFVELKAECSARVTTCHAASRKAD